MNPNPLPQILPAPCIIDQGLLVNKEDMKKVLNNLSQVHYRYTLEGYPQSEGDGWVLAVFADYQQATIVVHQSLYINVCSFDYLKLSLVNQESVLTLVQENRQLQLIPLVPPTPPPVAMALDAADLEAMVTRVLSARWDVQLDDDLF
jgi:hypothetical protein